MELADVVDSKSTGGDTVPVRVRPPAPKTPQTLSGLGCFYCRGLSRLSFGLIFLPCKKITAHTAKCATKVDTIIYSRRRRRFRVRPDPCGSGVFLFGAGGLQMLSNRRILSQAIFSFFGKQAYSHSHETHLAEKDGSESATLLKAKSVILRTLRITPSVTATPCHPLAAARSTRGSDSPLDCHSLPLVSLRYPR